MTSCAKYRKMARSAAAPDAAVCTGYWMNWFLRHSISSQRVFHCMNELIQTEASIHNYMKCIYRFFLYIQASQGQWHDMMPITETVKHNTFWISKTDFINSRWVILINEWYKWDVDERDRYCHHTKGVYDICSDAILYNRYIQRYRYKYRVLMGKNKHAKYRNEKTNCWTWTVIGNHEKVCWFEPKQNKVSQIHWSRIILWKIESEYCGLW